MLFFFSLLGTTKNKFQKLKPNLGEFWGIDTPFTWTATMVSEVIFYVKIVGYLGKQIAFKIHRIPRNTHFGDRYPPFWKKNIAC